MDDINSTSPKGRTQGQGTNEQTDRTSITEPATPVGGIGETGGLTSGGGTQPGLGTQSGMGSQGGQSTGESMGKGTPQGMREAWRSGRPEAVKEEAKKLAEKGVAAIAGALKGFAETAQREDMPGQAKEAVHQAGETAKQATGEAQNQLQGMGEQAKGVAKQAKQQAQDLRKEMGGGKSGGKSGGESGGQSGSSGGGSSNLTPTAVVEAVTIEKEESTPGAPSTAERDRSLMTEDEKRRGRERTDDRL